MSFEPEPPTAEGLDARVNQFSIFLPNKVGALMEVVKLLNSRNIHVLAISIQDSADTAIVRIVVTDPETVRNLFHEHEIPFSVCELCVVELSEGPTQLGTLLASLLAAEVNIFGSYALLTHPRGRTALAIHVEDNECACSVLSSHGFTILSQTDISR
jgi:hypothetical protein